MSRPDPRDFLRSDSGHLNVAVLFWFPIAALVLVLATDFLLSFGRHAQMWRDAQDVTAAVSVERGYSAERGLRTATLVPTTRN